MIGLLKRLLPKNEERRAVEAKSHRDYNEIHELWLAANEMARDDFLAAMEKLRTEGVDWDVHTESDDLLSWEHEIKGERTEVMLTAHYVLNVTTADTGMLVIDGESRQDTQYTLYKNVVFEPSMWPSIEEVPELIQKIARTPVEDCDKEGIWGT